MNGSLVRNSGYIRVIKRHIHEYGQPDEARGGESHQRTPDYDIFRRIHPILGLRLEELQDGVDEFNQRHLDTAPVDPSRVQSA